MLLVEETDDENKDKCDAEEQEDDEKEKRTRVGCSNRVGVVAGGKRRERKSRRRGDARGVLSRLFPRCLWGW